MRAYENLLGKIKSYYFDITPEEEELIKKAFFFSKDKHKGQKRLDGTPFFTHPVAVANIVADYHMDINTVMAALLHDIVEDTNTSYPEIKTMFGDDVAFLVKGVTNITNIKFKSKEFKQIRNYIKLLFAISKDIRVLILKLFDRLHNARTFGNLKSDETIQRKAFETFEIFLPLAERIGMDEIKDEYGEICLKWLYPEMHASIKKGIEDISKKGKGQVNETVKSLQKTAYKNDIDCTIYGRQKSVYSTWKKMNKKGASYDKIFDIIAFRFITKNVEDCYRLLGILHSNFKVIQGRFKDYISYPKSNNYQSLHTTIIGPANNVIEVQIRTEEMDDVASYGIAAHWHYKQSKSGSVENITQVNWIRNIVKNLKQSYNREDAIAESKLSLFGDSVFCFTPKGEVIDLPEGSGVLDFAYAIHTDVGNNFLGAKINRVAKNIRYKLQNGDMIEIVKSSKQKPTKEWLKFVKTTKAKNCINKAVADSQREDLVKLGRSKMQELFKEYKEDFSEKLIKKYAKGLDYEDSSDVYFSVGNNRIQASSVFFSIFPEAKEVTGKSVLDKNKRLEDNIELINRNAKKKQVSGSDNMGIPIELAKCCFPIPDEKIFGVVKNGKNITIHKHNCKVVMGSKEDNHIIHMDWEDIPSRDFYDVRIFIVADYKSAFTDVANTIIKCNSNISNIKVLHKNENFIEMIVDISIKDKDHIMRVIQTLRNVKAIKIVDTYGS